MQDLTPEHVFGSVASWQRQAALREWSWIQMVQRMTWLYGPAEALRRINRLIREGGR